MSNDRAMRRSSAAARLPSPPPPPQQRRSSLTMSIPSLENLLSRAPPVDLSSSSSSNNNNNSMAAPLLFSDLQQQRVNNMLMFGRRRESIPVPQQYPLFPYWGPTSTNADTATTITSADFSTTNNTSLRAVELEAIPLVQMPPPTQSSTIQVATFHRRARAVAESPLAISTHSTPRVLRSSTRLANLKRSAPDTTTRTDSPPPRRYRQKLNLAETRSTGRCARKKPPPQCPTTETSDACCICLTVPEAPDLALINGCAHSFCYACIQTWSETENSCPLCKARFTTISNVHSKSLPDTGRRGVRQVPTRNQRSEAGIALDGLLSSLAAGFPVVQGRFTSAHFNVIPNEQQQQLQRFLMRSLGPMGGGNAGTAGLPGGFALSAGDSGVYLGGVGVDPASTMLPSTTSQDPFDQGLLNVFLRSSSTITTTMTTSLGLLQQHPPHSPSSLNTAAMLAAAAAAASNNNLGAAVPGRSLETAIEIESDEEVTLL